jgi:NAD(P)-dependent dehydrogenase (short-subunit alcohol dehydrogenase family)
VRGLSEKVILIAGGSSGIGRAAAIRLADEGSTVLIGDIDEPAAQAVADHIEHAGGRAAAVRLDISDESSVKQFVFDAVERYGGIDGILINAADMRAIMEDYDAVEVSLEIFDQTLSVNLRGYFLCTRHVIPHLLNRGGGSIVYTTSDAAFAGEPTRVAYGISKSGVNALMRHVASRWGKQNIRANAIAPGFVPTEKNLLTAPKAFLDEVLSASRSARHGEPADIAAMMTLLLSDDGSWINGQAISVDGGTLLR